MLFIKSLRTALLLTFLLVGTIIFLNRFEIVTFPVINFGFEPVESNLPHELEYLFHNLFGSIYNGILLDESMNFSISVIFQYGLPSLIFLLIMLIRKKDEEEIEVKRGAMRVEPDELRNILLKEIYLKK